MSDLKGFAHRIAVRAEGIEDAVSKVVRKVALLVDTGVVLGTPVDTGRARANWQVSVGRPAEGVLPAPPSPSVGQQAALKQAQTALASYAGGEGVEIHITNNLPYIRRLNDGWSKQAPAGFVETAVAAGVAAVKAGLPKEE